MESAALGSKAPGGEGGPGPVLAGSDSRAGSFARLTVVEAAAPGPQSGAGEVARGSGGCQSADPATTGARGDGGDSESGGASPSSRVSGLGPRIPVRVRGAVTGPPSASSSGKDGGDSPVPSVGQRAERQRHDEPHGGTLLHRINAAAHSILLHLDDKSARGELASAAGRESSSPRSPREVPRGSCLPCPSPWRGPAAVKPAQGAVDEYSPREVSGEDQGARGGNPEEGPAKAASLARATHARALLRHRGYGAALAVSLGVFPRNAAAVRQKHGRGGGGLEESGRIPPLEMCSPLSTRAFPRPPSPPLLPLTFGRPTQSLRWRPRAWACCFRRRGTG